VRVRPSFDANCTRNPRGVRSPRSRVHNSPPYPDFHCKTGRYWPMGCFYSKPSAPPVQDSTPMRPLRPVNRTVPVPTRPQTVPEPPAPVSRAHRSRKGSKASTRSTKGQHGSTRHRAESAPQRVPSLSSQDPRNRAKTLSVPSGTSRANRPGPRLSTPGKSNA